MISLLAGEVAAEIVTASRMASPELSAGLTSETSNVAPSSRNTDDTSKDEPLYVTAPSNEPDTEVYHGCFRSGIRGEGDD